jgi:DNA invertase Pin-like site-specific DNA recombinase
VPGPDRYGALMADRAGRWYRVSTAGQDEESQIPDVDAWCQDHEYEVSDDTIYLVHGKSAYHGKHAPDLDKAFADMAAGKINVLVVWVSDRIERRGAWFALELAERARKANGRIEYVKEPHLNAVNEMSDVMLALSATLAKQESKRKADRTLSTQAILAGNGHWRGGRVPYGKRAICLCHAREDCPDRGKRGRGPGNWVLDIHQEHAALLRRVAGRVAGGTSVNAAVADLNAARELSADGKSWSVQTLRKILRSTESIDVLGSELWAEVQDAMGHQPEPGNRGTRTETQAMLLDVAWCAACADAGRDKGKLYRWHRPRTELHYARCRNEMKRSEVHEPCHFSMIDYDLLEQVVTDTILERYGAAEIETRDARQVPNRVRLDAIERALAELENARRTRKITRAEYQEQQAALFNEQDALEDAELAADILVWRGTGETVSQRWDRLEAAERRLWLLGIGLRAEVTVTRKPAGELRDVKITSEPGQPLRAKITPATRTDQPTIKIRLVIPDDTMARERLARS